MNFELVADAAQAATVPRPAPPRGCSAAVHAPAGLPPPAQPRTEYLVTDSFTAKVRASGATGVFYGVDRAHPELLEQQRPGEHLWICISTHVLDAETIRRTQRKPRQKVHLDAENIAAATIGCYVCEQSWSERVSYRRCPGEPT